MALYTVLDLEGTSKNPSACVPLSVSYLTFRDTFQNVVEANTIFFYKKNIQWSDEAEEIHHLSREFLTQFEPQYYENARELFRIMCRGNLIGQNIKAFDFKVLDRFLGALDYPEVKVTNLYDTMYVLGQRKKLGVIAETYGLSETMAKVLSKNIFKHTVFKGESTEYHNSEYDVIMTTLVYLHAKSKGYYG